MKSIIELIVEATKPKMSKIFSSIRTLENAITINHPGSRSTLPSTMTKEEFESLSNNIYKEYKVFVNSYIFTDDGELFLAWVKKTEEDTGKINGGTHKYKINIFMDLGHQINKLQFIGFDVPINGVSNNENLIPDFKNGISLNELIKKYKYDAASKLNSAAIKFINSL